MIPIHDEQLELYRENPLSDRGSIWTSFSKTLGLLDMLKLSG